MLREVERKFSSNTILFCYISPPQNASAYQRLLAKLLARSSDSTAYADAFVSYTGLMGRTLQLWRLEPRQPLLKRLLLYWTRNISDDAEMHWTAISGAWEDL